MKVGGHVTGREVPAGHGRRLNCNRNFLVGSRKQIASEPAFLCNAVTIQEAAKDRFTLCRMEGCNSLTTNASVRWLIGSNLKPATGVGAEILNQAGTVVVAHHSRPSMWINHKDNTRGPRRF